MKLSIIIVSYNVRYYLEQCLLSLQRATVGIETDIYVVDNHSRDDSVEYLGPRFPQVRMVSSNHNLGFARANNLAIRQSHGEYVLLLNPDTIVGESVLHEVLSFMDAHQNAGGVGVRMSKTDGSDAMESRRGLPTPMTAFYKMCGLGKRYPQSRRFGHYYMSYLPWDKPVRIDIISGAFFLLRRTALEKIGLLDEDFFMYGEDIDLSYRLLKGGFENWYVPSRILHYKGESTQKSSFRYVHVFYGAMLTFFRKHYGNMSVLLTIPVKLSIYLKATVALIQMQLERIRRSLGFLSQKKDQTPLFVFLGRAVDLEKCKELADRKGLHAIYLEGDEQTRPLGHLDWNSTGKGPVYIVYSTDSYRFETILKIFSSQPRENMYIGTYNPKSHIVITAEEVIQ